MQITPFEATDREKKQEQVLTFYDSIYTGPN